jgi:hypothetical protein
VSVKSSSGFATIFFHKTIGLNMHSDFEDYYANLARVLPISRSGKGLPFFRTRRKSTLTDPLLACKILGSAKVIQGVPELKEWRVILQTSVSYIINRNYSKTTLYR